MILITVDNLTTPRFKYKLNQILKKLYPRYIRVNLDVIIIHKL